MREEADHHDRRRGLRGALPASVEKLYPCEAYISLEGRQRKAMADQIATVSKRRLGSRAGELAAENTAGVERAIRVQLAL